MHRVSADPAPERLEPATEHVNAGIPGLAPDAYLAVLEAWIARQRFDAVTMHLFAGNDLRDLDGPYPCCGFATQLLTPTMTAAERWEHLGAILRSARDGLATALGIPLLDAAPVLHAALAEKRAIFDRPFDPHFNPAGHALVADWIHAAGW